MPQLGLGSSLSRGGVLSAGFENTYSLSFDGSDDTFQTVDFESVLQSSFTVSLWYKPDAGIPGEIEAVCGMVNNDATTWCYVYHLTDGKFRAYYKENPGSVTATTSTAQAGGAGSWIHIAYTMTEGGTESLQIYLNGSPDGSAATGSLDMDSFATGGKKFNFGSRNDNGAVDKVAAGLIDECAIWNTALSANDINSIYNSGVPNDLNDSASYETDRTGNLQGWWRMGDGDLDHRQTNGLVADQSLPSALGSDIASSLDWNTDDSDPYETFTSSGNSVTEADNTSGWGIASTDTFSLTAGIVYKLVFDFTLNSGAVPNKVLIAVNTDLGSLQKFIITGVENGLQAHYFTVDTTRADYRFGVRENSTTNWSLSDLTIKPVTGNAGVLANFDGSDFKEDVPS